MGKWAGLAAGREIVITRRGEPIECLAGIGRKRALPSHRDLRKAMRPMRRGSEEMIRQGRDASALSKWYLNGERSDEVEKYIQEKSSVASSQKI